MRLRDRIALYGTAAVLLGAPLALGGAPRWAALSLAVASVGLAALYAASGREPSTPSPLVAFVFAAAVLTAIQLLPLPAFLVELISPEKLELVTANARALGAPAPSWLPLSYDPPATLVELAKLAGYATFAIAAIRIAGGSKGRRQLVYMVAAAGIAVAVISLGHLVVGAERLYGLYHPSARTADFVAPLINENHLAGYLALVTPLCLALGLDSQTRTRIAWLLGAALTSSVALLARSRGGAVALLVGVVVVLGLYLVQRRGQTRARLPRSIVISGGVIALSATVLIVALAAGGVASELAATDTEELSDPNSKIGAWKSATSLVSSHPWTGVGRGAFEQAFTSVHPSGRVTFSHVENEYLQAVVDWGLLGALLLFGLAVILGRRVARRATKNLLNAGAVGGLAALLAHNIVDFNLQIPAVAFAAIAVAAAASGPRIQRIRSARTHSTRLQRQATLVIATACVALAWTPLGEPARATAEELSAAPPAASVDRAIRAAERHPADYAIVGLTARALFAKKDRRAVAVINRALSLNPHSAGLHHLAARILARSQRRSQALVEYRLALTTAGNPRRILRSLVRDFPDVNTALAGLPMSPDAGPALAHELDALGARALALAHARELNARHPSDANVLRTHARLALGSDEMAESAEAAKDLYAAEPSPMAARLYARALRATGRLPEAEGVLNDALARAETALDTEEMAHLALILGDLRLQTARSKEARDAYRTVLSVTRRTSLQLAAYRRLAAIEQDFGNHSAAESLRRRARALESIRN